MKSILFFSILLSFFAIDAKELNNKNDLDLLLNIGGIYNRNGHPENYQYLSTFGDEIVKFLKADIQYTYKASNKMKARFELDADNNRAGVIRIKEAWFQMPFKKHTTLKFGNIRKDLGIQGSKGLSERNLITKSMLYRHIKSFSVLDYDFMFRTKIEHNIKQNRSVYKVSFGGDENMRIFLNFAYSLKFKNSEIEISDLYVNHVDTRINKQNSNHLILTYHQHHGNWNNSIELFTGIDPNSSNGNVNKKTIYYLGSELQLSHFFRFTKRDDRITKGVEPTAQLGWLTNDTENIYNGFFELRGGFVVTLCKPFPVRWINNYETVLKRDTNTETLWSRHSSSISSVLQLKW